MKNYLCILIKENIQILKEIERRLRKNEKKRERITRVPCREKCKIKKFCRKDVIFYNIIRT